MSLCFGTTLACGGASTTDLHAAFASIQVDEARIEHAALVPDPQEVCAASAHLCDTARPLDDRDASARCARAEERCARATEQSP